MTAEHETILGVRGLVRVDRMGSETAPAPARVAS